MFNIWFHSTVFLFLSDRESLEPIFFRMECSTVYFGVASQLNIVIFLNSNNVKPCPERDINANECEHPWSL